MIIIKAIEHTDEQYGHTTDHVIGVFDDLDDMRDATWEFICQRHNRVDFKYYRAEVNDSAPVEIKTIGELFCNED